MTERRTPVGVHASRRPGLGRRRLLVAGVVGALVLAACGSADQGVTSRRSAEQGSPATTSPGTDTTDPTPDSTVPDTSNPLEPDTPDTTPPPVDGGVIDFGDAKTPQPYDNFLNAAFADIEAFWAENYPAVYGQPFEPVQGIYAHYPGRTTLPTNCGEELPYEVVEMNAFYAFCGDIIVYDDHQLLPDLVEKLGAAAVGVVAAHEYGHAVQLRSGFYDLDRPTVDGEQMADCFAGAWAAHVALGGSDLLAFDDTDVKGGIVAMIEVRDPPGIDVVADPNGHGTAFDRVGAFQEGFINGVPRCADFIDNPNPRIDLVFTDADLETGGDLPIVEMLELLPQTLETFWGPTLEASGVVFTPPVFQAFDPDGAAPSCDGLTVDQLRNDATFCASTNTIAYDEVFMSALYEIYGDLSFSYPLAVAYSDAVQAALQSALGGEPRELLNDCLVGAWIIDIVPVVNADGSSGPRNPNQEILLSAGDLDEVVLTAVALGDEAATTNVRGTAFEKIDAFRAGVQRGLQGCQDRIG